MEAWDAHSLFTNPSEVWSVGFVGEDGHSVMSGGDDMAIKLWDIRSTTRPMQVLKHFDAGATVIAPHPRQPNLVACGSYDETICLYDIRYLSPKKPLGHSGPLGGGIWRIKWHPYDDNRMLVAAMHGGCRIVQMDLTEDTAVLTATKEFTEHKSMAYGADWLVCNHPNEEEGYFEAAASCSFYDNAVFLWDTVA
jgi:diphthamide biosynthesis protein 7